MQYVKNGDGEIKAVIDRFTGLDGTGPLCSEYSFELRNLRLLSDGSLQLREGLVPLLQLPEDIRGATVIRRAGVDEGYLVAGNTVYYLTKEDEGYGTKAIGSLNSLSGKVSFFYVGGILVLMDGEEMWSVTPAGMEEAQAYIPLYGLNWSESNISSNKVHEKPNLLSKRLRIRYCLTTDTSSVSARALGPVSCDRVLVNGERIEGYGYSKTTNAVSLGKKYSTGSIVDIFVTMADDFAPRRSEICRARRMASVGNPLAERVMLYDTPDDNRVWISRTAPWDNRVFVREQYPGSLMIYLTDEDQYSVGTKDTRVTGVGYHYDRTLIFTSSETWMANGTEGEDGTLHMSVINSTQGCTATGGIEMLGNVPLSISGRRILRWDGNTDERDECNAQVISAPVEPLFPEAFATGGRIHLDSSRGELWCYVPGRVSRILIWQTEVGSWTSFDGFVPDLVFDLSGRVGVCCGKVLYVLDQTAGVDTDEMGVEHPIGGEYLSAFLDFGQAGAIKHIRHAQVTAQCESGAMTLLLERADGQSQAVDLAGDGEVLSVLHRRISMGRFRFLRVGFRTSGKGSARIFGLSITARS